MTYWIYIGVGLMIVGVCVVVKAGLSGPHVRGIKSYPE